MADYRFEQLVDMDMARRLLESHQRVSGMAYGLFDVNGNDILSVGWQEIWVSFHRAHPVTCVYCRENNCYINERLHEATDSFMEYCCPNGMVVATMAIIIDGAHLATFFIGQFFYHDAPPDREFFMSRAAELGFDCDKHLAALDRVPTFSRDYVRDNMLFLQDMVQRMSGMALDSLKRLREIEAKSEQQKYLSSLLDSALNQAADAVFLIDGNQRLVFVNEAACRSLEYSREELLQLTSPDIDPDVTPEMASAMLAELFATGRQAPFESRHKTKSGRIFPVEISVAMFAHGTAQYSLCVARDCSERKQMEDGLREAMHAAEAANRSLRLLSASNRTLLHCTDEEDQLLQICRIAVELGGYSAAWVGLALDDEEKSIMPLAWFGIDESFFSRTRMSWCNGEQGASAMGTAIRTGSIHILQDILNDPGLALWHQIARKLQHQSAIALPLRVEGKVIAALAIYAPDPDAFQQSEVALLDELACDLAFGIQTIRMRRAHDRTQAHVRQLAYYDRLTGLPNQFMFTEELDRRVAAASSEGQTFALLLLDLNHLHEINETHGHTIGDQILVRVAQQLREICGQDHFVARFGGDFAIISHNSDQIATASLGERILAAITTPFHLSGQRLIIGGSVGMVVYPADSEGAGQLLSKVDLATSRAKAAGGGFCFYQPEMGEQLARTLKLAHRLELALQTNVLELFYQPKVNLVTGQMVGAEALLRWNDPELGWISPAEFIPVAEDRGMMIELGNWVLRSACCQIRQWQDEGSFKTGRIAINVSARQLETTDFLGTFTATIEEAGIAANCLELELTESILMSDPEQAINSMGALKNQGFSLAIDDFGTGYSSLAYLKRFPVDTLKIDRAFVRDMLVDQNDRAIVATIVAMAQQLGLITVAEGIEEEGQRLALLQLGCQQAQGFHFSRPVPAEEFRKKWLCCL